LVGALGVAAGTFLVSAHGGDTSKIHACVKNSNGTLRIVGANDTCANNETALDWNIQGPPGPSGPPGPTGIPGSGGSGLNCIGCNKRDFATRFNITSFTNQNFDLANFVGIHLPAEDFTGSSFVNAIIRAGDIRGSNFTNTDLTNANMITTDLRNVNFTGASLTGLDLTKSSLGNVNFTDANLQGAIGMDTASQRENIIWSNTTCPDGTNSDDNGNTCEGHF
jgi:hypothetical protein